VLPQAEPTHEPTQTAAIAELMFDLASKGITVYGRSEMVR